MKNDQIQPIRYYFIIASNRFLLLDEPVEEILRERVQHYNRVKKPIDFWLVKSPKFMESNQLSSLRAQIPAYRCSAVVSTNQTFITWLKLRFQNVAIGSFNAPTKEISSPLSSNA